MIYIIFLTTRAEVGMIQQNYKAIDEVNLRAEAR